MNKNAIKTFLCLYMVGLSGCNGVNDASYMQRGQDPRKPGPSRGRSRPGASAMAQEADIRPVIEDSTFNITCREMMSDSLKSMKEAAEEDEKSYEDSKKEIKKAEERTASLKELAEGSRKDYEDSLEESRRGDGGEGDRRHLRR